jgi:hypothetical protein
MPLRMLSHTRFEFQERISASHSYKSEAPDSWDFMATFFNAGKDFRAEIRQNTGKVQNADRLD